MSARLAPVRRIVDGAAPGEPTHLAAGIVADAARQHAGAPTPPDAAFLADLALALVAGPGDLGRIDPATAQEVAATTTSALSGGAHKVP